MAPKFPNPDPATDSVRDRLNQFIEVAGRAVYPPLAVAPSPTTPGQIWWDISDTIKIRDEANAAWDDLLAVMGGQVSGGYVQYDAAQTLTSGEKTQALTNIGAQPAGSYQPAGGYVRYDATQTLTAPQQAQGRDNLGLGTVSIENTVPISKGGTGGVTALAARNGISTPLSPASSLGGDWRGGQVGPNAALVLPAGGTWAWECDSVSTGGTWAAARTVGTSAGGSQVMPAQSGIQYMYKFWKVA